jgi:hypothetical protein
LQETPAKAIIAIADKPIMYFFIVINKVLELNN